jgi:colanic acid biosynthesis glycosyl transferase WcaI
MDILMVVAYFIPEIGSAAHVYYDLARAFVNRGHSVDVLSSYPRIFNLSGEDRGSNFPLDETMDGIHVHRCRHPADRDNIMVRGLEHFYLPFYYFRKYRQMGKKFDVCLIYIPPLPLYYLAKWIKRYDGTPSVLNFQDFHPQELTDVGMLKNPLMIKIMEHIERESYQKADYITVLSRRGVQYVVERGCNPGSVCHIYNAISSQDLGTFSSRRDFKTREGIEGKVLISYAGILSPFQGTDSILDVAKKLENHKNIIFCIAGDGMLKNHLEERVKNEKITNVVLLPFLKREEYFNLINSSDISMVSLDTRMRAPCLPGKLINLMAVQQPIVALIPEDCETADVLRSANCGSIVNPGDIAVLEEKILELVDNPDMRKQYGDNGRRFLETQMNLENNLIIYETIFAHLVGEEGQIFQEPFVGGKR